MSLLLERITLPQLSTWQKIAVTCKLVEMPKCKVCKAGPDRRFLIQILELCEAAAERGARNDRG